MPEPLTLGRLASVERGQITLHCWPCQRWAHYANADVCATFGADVPFEALKARVTCRECGRGVDGDLVTLEPDLGPKPREAALRDMWGGFGGRDQLVDLMHSKKPPAAAGG